MTSFYKLFNNINLFKKGVVPAKRLLPIVIALTPARLGPLNIPLYFRVSGSLLPPMELR